MSLRRFLLLWLSVTLVAVLGLAAVLGYLGSRHEAEELLDAQMAQYARLLYANLDRLHRDPALLGPIVLSADTGQTGTASGHRYENKLLFQFWQHDHLLARSANAPDSRLFEHRPGFHDTVLASNHWRVFVLPGDNAKWLLVADRDDIRTELALSLAAEAILPLLIGLPLLLVLVWLVVGRALGSVHAITRALQQRAPSDLTALDDRHTPTELTPLVKALNRLFARLDTVLAMEQRFSADAAHELRTPITAIKLHLDNALAGTTDTAARHSLQQAQAAARRMTHIVQQLLALNRSLSQGASPPRLPVALEALVQAAVEEHRHAARQAGVSLTLETVPASVAGHADLLQILLRNLIDNALRYTPRGGRVHVQLGSDTRGSRLCISDSGPGIPAAERERVLERFYRFDGDSHPSGQEGCGLGLAIVKRVADYHGATLTLGTDPLLGGLAVCLTFAPLADTRR